MPRISTSLAVLPLLIGCWRSPTPSDPVPVPFRHPDLATESGVILTYEPQPALLCPDGKPARFYVAYNSAKTETTEPIEAEASEDDSGDSSDTGDSGDSGEDTGAAPPPIPDTADTGDTAGPGDTGDSESGAAEPPPPGSPVAIVLHSSAFDYVVNPTPGSPLSGEHYRSGAGDITRLHRDWGIKKVWETLGQGESIEPTEVNNGALPAALINDGVVAIYPINCWGDLWHNDTSTAPNDLVEDLGVLRNGHTMAWWMVRFLQDLEFAASHEAQISLNMDLEQLFLIGLGDGARGVADLLRRDDMPPVAGVLLDAPVEDLSSWATEDSYSAERVGLERLYNFSDEDLERPEPNWWSHSIRSLVGEGKLSGVRTALVYSDADPRVPFPESHYDGLASNLESIPGNWVVNAGTANHVFSNRDNELASNLVNFLLSGEIPAEPVEEEDDTGQESGSDTGAPE